MEEQENPLVLECTRMEINMTAISTWHERYFETGRVSGKYN